MTLPMPFSARVRRRFTIVCVCCSVLGCATPHRRAPDVATGGDSTGAPLSPLVGDDESLDAIVLQVAADACAADANACSALASTYVAMATETDTFDLALMAADNGCSRGDSASCAIAVAVREQPADASLESSIWNVLLAACMARPTAECAGVTRWYLAQGSVEPTALRRLGAALEPACGRDTALACAAVGDVAWMDGRRTEAQVWYERGCDLNDGYSCWMLALAWGTGAFGAQDRARSAVAFGEACRKGYSRGCLWRASALSQAWGHDQETYAAGFLMDIACLRGERAGCGNVGDSLHGYTHGPQVRLRSSDFGLDRLECVADAERCFYVAMQEFIASRDVESLRRVADVLCQRGEYTACTYTETVRRLNLAAVRAAPEGVFVEPCRRGEYSACLALEHAGAPWSLNGAERACQEGNLLACLDVSAHTGGQFDGALIVVPRTCADVPSCAEADHDCSLGRLDSCADLGYQLAFDGAISQEPGRAARAFYSACHGGDVDSCYRIGQLELVQGDADARTRAIQRIRLACRAGHPLACLQSWRLESMQYDAVEFACREALALACLTGPDGGSVL